MSIEQTDVIDVIGVEVATGKVILTISDHLDWSDERGHLQTLQAKINKYIAFIESGELLSSYPKAGGRQPVIDVVARVAWPSAADRFFSKAREVLGSAGIELRTSVFEEDSKPESPQ